VRKCHHPQAQVQKSLLLFLKALVVAPTARVGPAAVAQAAISLAVLAPIKALAGAVAQVQVNLCSCLTPLLAVALAVSLAQAHHPATVSPAAVAPAAVAPVPVAPAAVAQAAVDQPAVAPVAVAPAAVAQAAVAQAAVAQAAVVAPVVAPAAVIPAPEALAAEAPAAEAPAAFPPASVAQVAAVVWMILCYDLTHPQEVVVVLVHALHPLP